MKNVCRDFEGKKITVLGLGLLGRGVGDVEFLAKCGAQILVTDRKTEAELAESVEKLKNYQNVTFHLGSHDEKDFTSCDMVLKAAGVPLDSPYIDAARAAGVPVYMSTALFAKYAKLKVLAVYGGESINKQIHSLASGVHIVVGTPGRLIDLMERRVLNLSTVKIVVLDEADRMLDMGFINDIRKIIKLLPPKRQNLLFSATYSDDIRGLAERLLHDPLSIQVAPRNAPIELVEQRAYRVQKEQKRHLLVHLIQEGQWRQVLIFTRTKHGANRLTQQLEGAGIQAAAIHGNKSQGQRERALAAFRAGTTRVLVATDIAARGIDVAGISHVINYDVPKNPEDYVHRIGRTGRALAVGDAFTLATPEEAQDVRDIERFISQKIPQAKLEGFDYGAAPLYPPRPPQQGHGGGRPNQGGRGYQGGGQRQHGGGGGQYRGQSGGQPQKAAQSAAGPAGPQSSQPRPQAGGLTRGHWNPGRR